MSNYAPVAHPEMFDIFKLWATP